MHHVPEEAVVLTPYDPAWPGLFERERLLLEPVLRKWLKGPIEHVGSTAVPGLPAKPIVDIMAGVQSLESSRGAIEALVACGYHHFPYRAEVMHWFCKPSPARRTHHLHLVPVQSPLWAERLAFRDLLRHHPEIADAYARLKTELAQRHHDDREAYTEAKGPFIARVLAEAREAGTLPALGTGPR